MTIADVHKLVEGAPEWFLLIPWAILLVVVVWLIIKIVDFSIKLMEYLLKPIIFIGSLLCLSGKVAVLRIAVLALTVVLKIAGKGKASGASKVNRKSSKRKSGISFNLSGLMKKRGPTQGKASGSVETATGPQLSLMGQNSKR